MDRGASPRTGDVGSGPGGTKDAHKKALGPQDGGGGPSTVIALGGNGSGSSYPTKPVDLDADTKKRYRPRHFKRVKERRNRRKRDQDERLFIKGLKAKATNEEPNRKERREGVQGFKPPKKTVKLSVPPPKTVIVDDGSNKFGSLRVESEVPSLISKTTTISTTTSVEEDVYWSPCESTDKPVISYKVEDLDPKDERDSKICNVVLRGNHYINKQERRTTFVGALKTHFDAHKSGDDGLSKKEVNAALKSFAKKDRTGKFRKLEELEALFGDMDLNGAGRVSYDELTDFIDDIDADDIGAGRNHRGKGAGGIKTIYLKEDRVPKLDYIYREDLQVTYSLKLGRLKLRLKLRYIIQQLAFRRQHKVSLKVTHLMAETFKHNLMFLNNIPNKDVVVSHGLLALPSTSAFDGAATAAPGEASFEGQHAALAALGQAVLAALGVAFFQGSTPIDVVGGYVFSLDVLGDALSLDVLTNSNVLHKTGFMGAAPTVVFLGGSEGLNALLLDASAAAALDGVFKGLFGVAALRGQPVVVGAAPDVPWYNSSDGLDVFSGNLCQRAGGARLVGALTDSLDGLRTASLAVAVADAACVQGSASLDVALCQNSPRAVARLVGALTDSLDGLRKAGLAAAVADAACVQDPEAVLSDKPLLAEAMEEDRLDSMKEQKVIQILVMTASGAMPSVFVKPWATVGDLMLVIQQMMDVPLSKYQHLQSIGGRPMQNAALLQHYDIQNNSTVVLSEPWPGHLLGGSLLSLKELIDKGSLNVGDIIVFREHNHQEEGELLENGWIRHEGTVYKSASAFVGAMRGKPSSGYDFLYTATGTPIQSLRSDPSDSSSNGDDLRSDSNSDDEAPPQPPGDQQLAGRRRRQPTERFDHQTQVGQYYVKRGSAVGGADDGDDDVVMEDDDEQSQLQQALKMSMQPMGEGFVEETTAPTLPATPGAAPDHARPGGVPPPPSLPPAKRSLQPASPTSGNVKVFFDDNFLPSESVLQGLRNAGVRIVGRPRDATHIVCEEPLRLSLTFTAASCVVDHAVTHEWVEATIEAGRPLEATNYVVDSHELEQDVGFNLADNLRRNREAVDRSELRLLQDKVVCVDPDFQWRRDLLDDLQEMIDCSDAMRLEFSDVVDLDGTLPQEGAIIICKDDSGLVDEAIVDDIASPTTVVKYWDLCEYLLRRAYPWDEATGDAQAPGQPPAHAPPRDVEDWRSLMGATVVTPEGSNGRCVALHVDSSSEEDRELSELRWEAGGFIEEGLLRRNVGFVEFEAVSPSDGLPHVLRWDGAPKPNVRGTFDVVFADGTPATVDRIMTWLRPDQWSSLSRLPDGCWCRPLAREPQDEWGRIVGTLRSPDPGLLYEVRMQNEERSISVMESSLVPIVLVRDTTGHLSPYAVSALRRPASQGADGGDVQTGGDPSPPPAPPAPREALPEEAGNWPKAFIELLREKKVKCKFKSPNPKRGASAARYDGYMRATNIGDYYDIFRGNMSDLRNDITKGYCQLDKSERDDAWLEYLESGEDLQSKAEKPKAKKPKAKPAAKSGAGAEDTTDEDMFGTNTTPPAEPLVLPPDWNESKQRAKDPELEAAVCALGAALTGKTSFTKEWDLLLKHRCYCFYIHEDDPANKAVKNLEVPIGWPSYKEFSKSPKKNKPSSLRLLRQYLKYALQLAKEGDKYCLDDEQSESNRFWPEEREKFHGAMATLNINRSGRGLSREDCRRIAEHLPNKTPQQVHAHACSYFSSFDAEAQAIEKLTSTGDSYVKSVLGTDTINTSELLFCIISTGRWIDAKFIELRLSKAGLEASQILWVVGTPEEVAKYKSQCSGEVVVGGGLSASRNKALETARARNRVCVQLRDSVWKCVVIQEGPEEGGSLADFYNKNGLWKEPPSLEAANTTGSKNVEVTLVAAALLLHDLMKARDKRLAGCFPVPNKGFAASKEPVQQRELVDERLLVIDPEGTKFDESLNFREVDEFTAQHIHKYDGIYRSNRVLCVGQGRKGKTWVTPEGPSEEDKQNAIDSLLNKHRDLFRERIIHNRTTRPHDRYVLSWEQDASSEPKDQNETMEDVQPGEQTVLSTQLPFDAGSLAALECPSVPMRELTPEDKFIRFAFLARETVECENGRESKAALIVPHEAGKEHEPHKGQLRVLAQLVKGRFTHKVKFASRASKKLTILGEDDYGFEFKPTEAPAMYRDTECIFVLDPRAKGSSFIPRCAHAKGFVTLAPGCACGLECPGSQMEIHQHHITAHERDCLLAPSTHCINSGLLASGIWGRQRPLHEQLNKLWGMIKHQHSINDKTFVHLAEISVPVETNQKSGEAYPGNATLMNAFKPGGELSKHLKVADPTRVHELLPEGLPDDVATGGTYYELKKDSEKYFPFWGRDTLLYYESKKTLSVVYGKCPITGVGGRKTKRTTRLLVLHHITVDKNKECFVGFINDNVNRGLGSTDAPDPFA